MLMSRGGLSVPAALWLLFTDSLTITMEEKCAGFVFHVFHETERTWRVCKGTSLCIFGVTGSVIALLNSEADRHDIIP